MVSNNNSKKINAVSLLLAGMLWASSVAHAAGQLETPTANETTSGIGTLSGWHCTARSVTFMLDALGPFTAATGTERKDTQSVCGAAKINSGFSLLLNYNDLPIGAHTLVAFADGVEFDRVTFNNTNFGTPFLTGKSGRRVVRNFPDLNQSTIVQWREARQNFDIIGRGTGSAVNPSPLSGTYYGAAGTQCASDPQPTMQDERFARFEVAAAPDNQSMSVLLRYSDGFQCTLSGAMSRGDDGYYVVATPTSTCQLGATGLRIEADGLRVKGIIGTVPGGGCFTTRAFYGARPSRPE